MNTLLQRCVAELIGTFAIVFFGCGAIIVLNPAADSAQHLAVNVVFGLVVATMIYTLGHVSMAHFNPAVTVGMATGKLFPWKEVAPYLVAQTLGAILASGLHLLIIPSAVARSFGATQSILTPVLTLALEGILTFFLVLVILGTATDKRASPGFAGLAIGFTVLLNGTFAGPLTGNSMNPARSFGPALFAGIFPTQLPYLVGPILGSCLAVFTYQFLRPSEKV